MLGVVFLGRAEEAHSWLWALDADCLVSKKKRQFSQRMGVRHPDVQPLEEQWLSSSCHLPEPSFGHPSPAPGPAGARCCSFGAGPTVAELWHVGALAHGSVQSSATRRVIRLYMLSSGFPHA